MAEPAGGSPPGDAGPNAEIVRGITEAISRGDLDAALEPFDENVRWVRPPDVPVTGTIEGLPGVKKMWKVFGSSVENFELKATRLRESGDQVLAHVTFRGTAPEGRGDFEFSGAQVYRLRDSRVIEVLEFRTIPEAEAALGSTLDPPSAR